MITPIPNLKCHILDSPTMQDWARCKEVTLGTIGKHAVTPVDSAWKARMIASEHSPIRELTVCVEFENIPYYVATHLVRHHVGCQPYQMSQRNDRQENYDREKAPQDAPVLLRMTMNFQSIIDISKVRLCNQADAKTHYAWVVFLAALGEHEPEITAACVPKCVYRNGLCSEPFPCTEGVPRSRLLTYRKFILSAKGKRC